MAVDEEAPVDDATDATEKRAEPGVAADRRAVYCATAASVDQTTAMFMLVSQGKGFFRTRP